MQNVERSSAPTTSLFSSIRHLWCRHRETVVTPKLDGMPAHVVCVSCGWREPVLASAPQGTRTWDSTRDDVRYKREKRRRVAVEEEKQMVMARLTTPAAKQANGRRTRRGNVVEMKRVVGE